MKIFLICFLFCRKETIKGDRCVVPRYMLEIVCNYSILNHKRMNYKICFVFQGVDNKGVFWKSRDKVVPLWYLFFAKQNWSCQAKRFVKYKWLDYNGVNDNVTCFICKKHLQRLDQEKKKKVTITYWSS